MEYSFQVNGFEVQARYDEATVAAFFRPFLERLARIHREKGGRTIAFLAAPPAAGKSTLAAFLEHLSRTEARLTPIQALGMDGFHHHQDYILTHTVQRGGREVPMKSVKGAPESFDVDKLAQTLERVRGEDLRWPFYDRRLHDVVEDALPVSAGILLVEGNWLLLDEPVWRDFKCDLSMFIGAQEQLLRERLIQRKMRGGSTRAAAEAFYETCDGPNIRRCMSGSRRGDVNLAMLANGVYRQAP